MSLGGKYNVLYECCRENGAHDILYVIFEVYVHEHLQPRRILAQDVRVSVHTSEKSRRTAEIRLIPFRKISRGSSYQLSDKI